MYVNGYVLPLDHSECAVLSLDHLECAVMALEHLECAVLPLDQLECAVLPLDHSRVRRPASEPPECIVNPSQMH